MSTKRKRAPDVEPEVSTPASKKKKGRLTMAEKQKRDVEMAKGEYVIRKLKRAVNPSKKLAADSFIRLPSRRLDSNFYEKVKDPIDITTIQLRLKTPDYMTFQEFCDDINLLIKNTLGYYKKDSEEFKDMKIIEQVFKESKLKVENGEYEEDDEVDDEEEEDEKPEVNKVQEESEDDDDDDREDSPFEIDIAMVETILLSILECTDKTGRLLCPPFKVLQPEVEFPLYYEKIKNPIDLKTIAERGREGKYQTMQELKADLKLLFSNAQTFSGKGTDIYKDAEQLKSCMKEEIRKIEEKRIHPLRRQKAHRLVDALLEESAGSDNYSEDSEEDEDTENNSDPLWQMYWTIRNAKHEKDRTITLADNFLELPSRAMYHDYFDEIETPISLFMINKKLKNGELDMRGLVKDLLQMFSNACEYNMETSGVYIAAKKLEQITLITLKKLAPELVAEFGSRLYVPPQQQQQQQFANNSASKTPFKGRPKIKMEYDSEDSRTPPPSVKRKRSPKKSSEPGYVETRGRKSNFEINEMNKQKMVMLSVWNAVHNFKPDPTGMYWPCGAFIQLPSHKEYPDYYRLIKYPIDMTKIKQRLDSGKYKVAGELVEEMKIMFNNAREFNEPGSQIHQDACRLEEVMRNSYEAMMSASLTLGSPPMKPTSRSKSSVKRRHHDIETDTDEDSRGPPTPRNYRSTTGGYPQQYGLTAQQFSNQRIEKTINSFSEEESRMWRAFQAIKNCRDDEGRHIGVHFWKLPTREELPSYYDVIKRPMDLTKIQNKLKTKSYLTFQDIFADFSLMLSNACKFNEPESPIYKDAVIVQRNLFELKRDLDQGDKVPKVQLELRTIFTSMFATIFNKKDENGSCYSDTFVELNELLKTKGVPETEWPFTFDQIKINIDKCRYRRLDRFQKDFFNLCETARQVSKIGSPIYEAAIVLQKLFIVERDKKCKESIKSNAYIVIEKDIEEAIEFEAVQRAKEEANEEEEPSSAAPIKRHESEVDVKKVVHDDVEYSPPCYAYISRTDERKSPLHIFRIERVFINENGDEAVQGFWVYRPEETLHLASRKFMKKEVFITPFRDTVLANRLRGSCVVVSYQTFVSNKIGSFDEEDIYVCESKYYGKPKYFGKLKWPYMDEDEELETEKRDRILSPKRLINKIEKNEENRKDDSDDDDDADRVHDFMLDIDREETPASSSKEEVEGRTYFHQIKTKTSKFYTLGQFVLVFNASKPLCDVMRIHKLWRDKDGSEWFSGGWFARPIETIHDKDRHFYTREVIAVYRNDEVRQISDIQGLCDVQSSKTYILQRQTDISEYDVFVCDSMVHGTKDTPDNCLMFETKIDVNPQEIVPMNLDYAKQCRKLKTFRLLQSIPNEELYYFKQPITMEKEISPLTKIEAGGHVPLDHLDDMLDDDTDGSESVASANLTNQPPTAAPTPTPKVEQQSASPPVVPTTPTPQDAKPAATTTTSSLRSTPAPPGTQLVTTAVTIVSSASLASVTPKAVKSKSGYILFSAEVRKRIMQENPDSGFGEVSKIVGIEWKKLSDEQKKQYESRAESLAQEKAKLDAIKLAAERTLQPGQVRIYQCKWANCDSQFDAEPGLSEHIVQHHTSQIIMDSEQQYVCMWMTCLRNRKDGKPFPSLPRLHRHMKEKHVPTACRNVYQNQIGKNFFKLVMNGENGQLINAPYGRLPPPGAQQQQQQPQQQQQQHTQQMTVVQQQPQMNGVNGHHHHHNQHHAPPTPQQVQYQQNGVYHHQGPSSSQAPQIAPQPQQYQQQQQHTVHQVVHQPSQHVIQQQQQPQQQQQTQQAQVIISDPGRTIVRAVVPAFVAPPNSIHSRRVLHSEAYLKYIESLATNRQKSVSRWERSIGATHRNTQQGPAQQNGQRVPTHWIKKNENGRPVAREEDVTRALWKLRDELLQSTCNVLVDRQAF